MWIILVIVIIIAGFEYVRLRDQRKLRKIAHDEMIESANKCLESADELLSSIRELNKEMSNPLSERKIS